MTPTELVLAFPRIRAYLVHTARPHQAAPDGNFLQLAMRDGADADILMRPLTSDAGRPWLALSVALGPTDRYAIRAALVANDELPLGGLSDHEGTMLLRQTLPLASLPFAHLEQAWQVMARTASAITQAAALPRAARGEAPFAFVLR